MFGLAIAATTGLLVGCPPSAPTEVLEIGVMNLEPLGDDFEYEGWFIVNGTPVSTGTFDIDEQGNPVPDTFQVLASDAAAATKFVVSIEPDPDPSAQPADTKLVAGDFANGSADAVIGDAAALGDDFQSADGEFILDTPTTSAIAQDYALGIWWLDPAGPSASLSLPALPAGWVYEGWVADQDGPVSTGTFTDPAAADADGAGATAGPDSAPPFPGQDFINPPMPLPGMDAVISVEPDPDNSPAPFSFKPLAGDITDAGQGVLQPMANNAANTAPVVTADITS
jgi:hypothetical protein